MRKSITLILIGYSLCTTALSHAQNPTPQDLTTRAVKILARCAPCHADTQPDAKLSLTSRTHALRGGTSGSALVPGKPESSLLYQRVVLKQMPPKSPLTAYEVATLKQWIEAGADWGLPATAKANTQRAGKDWWSLQPLKRQVPPKTANTGWVKSPIDAFILANLEKERLHPAPPADKATLLRRATLDLLGIPPTLSEVETFLKDTSQNAYKKQIERLLNDPRYGERWARHWLDVVRYGESHGFERDQIRPNAWRYRDYVIDAFNTNKPYGQFIKEQIAGDVLKPLTRQGIIATGFLVAAPWDEVGHSQVSELYRARVREEEMEEITGTVGQTFLGLTVNCARCHDHKFDPISQKNYYRLKCALDGVQHGNRPLTTPEGDKVKEALLKQIRDEIRAIRSKISVTEEGLRNAALKTSPAAMLLPNPLARWTFDLDPRDIKGMMNGTLINGARVENGHLTLSTGNAYFQSAPLSLNIREKTLEAWVRLSNLDQQGGGVITLQMPDGSQFDSIVFGERQKGYWIAGSEGYNRTRDVGGEKEISSPNDWIHVVAVYRTDNSITLYRNGNRYGVSYLPTGGSAMLRAYPTNGAEVLIGLRHKGAGNGYLRGEIAEARLYDTALSPGQVAESYRVGFVDLTLAQLTASLTHAERAEQEKARQALKRLESELTHAAAPSEFTYSTNPAQPTPTVVLIRGDVEKRGDIVTPAGLEAISYLKADFGLAPDAPEGARRIALAEWIADSKNALTWRVMANRVWHYHFGKGIVASPNDFGYNGERPTHPELLDWLAYRFVESGGSVKSLHKIIMLSNTYQQSSQFNKAAAAKDSDDRTLWRFAPRRLEGEAVRDSLLFVSGQLNPKRGGESFQPFTVRVDNSHFYTQFDSGEAEYNRRSVYRMNVQSARSPLLETLDCPDPSTKTPRRALTTTPLQALELMNNSFVLRQAKRWSERLAREASTPLQQIENAYKMAFGRNPTGQERIQSSKFVQNTGLESLCWALMNSSEFLYIR